MAFVTDFGSSTVSPPIHCVSEAIQGLGSNGTDFMLPVVHFYNLEQVIVRICSVFDILADDT